MEGSQASAGNKKTTAFLLAMVFGETVI